MDEDLAYPARSMLRMLKRDLVRELLEKRKLGAEYDKKLEKLGYPTMSDVQNEIVVVVKEYEEDNQIAQDLYLQLIENSSPAELRTMLENIRQENICCICMAQWLAKGDHRLVSLKCGHLFGEKCIRTHLLPSCECPVCRVVALEKDIRQINLYNK
ncbi:hypothetical protein KR084_005194, partial [Drosophila pseudotakahashii]